MEGTSSLIGVIIFCVLIGFFFYSKEQTTPLLQPYLAMGLLAIYWLIYLFIPPVNQYHATQLTRLYEFIPLIAFTAILFPYFNPKTPEVITRSLGWLGLVVVSALMIYFKWMN